MAKSRYNITIADIERGINSYIIKQGIIIGPPEMIEVADALTTGEMLYKANLGTKEHPLWIYGDKESIQKRIGSIQREILNMLKGNNNGDDTSSIHNE